MFGWLFKNKEVEEKPVFEKIENKSRYRTANPYYYKVVDGDDSYLFTLKDIESARKRAKKNPEDVS